MPETPTSRGLSILRQLCDHEVDFIVVEGVAVLEGAPINTFDIDLVHSRQPDNIARLLAALDSLEAAYRIRPDLKPNASHLASTGHHLLNTRFGPLDVLATIGGPAVTTTCCLTRANSKLVGDCACAYWTSKR